LQHLSHWSVENKTSFGIDIASPSFHCFTSAMESDKLTRYQGSTVPYLSTADPDSTCQALQSRNASIPLMLSSSPESRQHRVNKAHARLKKKAVSVPLRSLTGTIQAVSAILDTNAEHSVIPRHLVDELGLTLYSVPDSRRRFWMESGLFVRVTVAHKVHDITLHIEVAEGTLSPRRIVFGTSALKKLALNGLASTSFHTLSSSDIALGQNSIGFEHWPGLEELLSESVGPTSSGFSAMHHFSSLTPGGLEYADGSSFSDISAFQGPLWSSCVSELDKSEESTRAEFKGQSLPTNQSLPFRCIEEPQHSSSPETTGSISSRGSSIYLPETDAEQSASSSRLDFRAISNTSEIEDIPSRCSSEGLVKFDELPELQPAFYSNTWLHQKPLHFPEEDVRQDFDFAPDELEDNDPADPADGEGNTTGQTPSGFSLVSGDASGHGTKRRRDAEGSGDGDGGNDRAGKRWPGSPGGFARPHPPDLEGLARRYACPYQKYDPEGERRCAENARGFQDPNRVK